MEEQVVENVMDWVEVKRRSGRKTARGKQQEESRKNCKTIQICVKVDGSTVPSDKVGDIVKRILSSACCNKGDVYMTCDRRMLKGSDELKSCRVIDVSTDQVTSRMRGGGKHKDKKNKVEKQQVTSPNLADPPHGQLEQKDAVD